MKRKHKIFVSVIVFIVLCFGMTFTSFAAFFEGWGGILYGDYGITTAYAQDYNYFTYNYLSGYAQANNMPCDFNIVNNSGLGLLFNSTANEVYNGFSSIENPTEYYTSVDTTIAVETMPIVVVGRSGGTQNLATQITWMRLSGSGKFAIVDNYIVSDSAFTVYMIGNGKDVFIGANGAAAFCNYVDVNTADSNGLYKTAANTVFINGLYNSSDFRLIFTDIPCYLSTISGNSGFQSINDFTFVADNVNYNYLLLDGLVNDPQVPEITNPEWDFAKHALTFRLASVYGLTTAGTDKITHNMTFNWNNDMFYNPEYYVLNLSYKIVYRDLSLNEDKEFYYGGYVGDNTISQGLELLAYNTNNGTLNSKYCKTLRLEDFYDNNNVSFVNYFNQCITTSVGTFDPDPYGYLETLENTLDYLGLTEGQTIPTNKRLRGLTTNSYIRENITKFVLYSYVSVGRVSDPSPGDVPIGGNIEQDYVSGVNESCFDFLQNKANVISNDNATNFYPPEEGLEPSVIMEGEVVPSNTVSGENIAQGGQGGNAYVQINTNPMSGWSPKVIKSIKDAFDFIEDQLSEYKDNNFLGFMIESYKIIPDPFWNMVALAGGVITGFAIIRFIRNK